MNGTRANRRKHEYRGGQWTRDLSAAEEKELSSPEYSIGFKDKGRVPTFDETGVPYNKNYKENKEAFDALDKARFETEVPLWPRDKNGTRQNFSHLQEKVKASGEGAKDAAEAKRLNTFYPHQAGGLFCSVSVGHAIWRSGRLYAVWDIPWITAHTYMKADHVEIYRLLFARARGAFAPSPRRLIRTRTYLFVKLWESASSASIS